MVVHDKGRDARREWEVSAPLRRGLEDLPLRAVGERLAGLRPLVEAELGTIELIERRRRLTEKERRQASALRDLLGSIRENEGAAAARLAERREV